MNETRFNRGSWIALVASTILILTMLLVNVYRYTLPTDGWLLNDPLVVAYSANTLGLPSPLQPGDVPVFIESVPVEKIYGTLPEAWRVGGTVQVTIKRGDQTLTVPVPIGNWNLTSLGKGNLADWGGNLTGLLYFLIGGFVFVRRPRNIAAQVLLFFGTVGLVMSLTFTVPISFGDLGDAFALTAVLLLGYFIWGILLFPTLLLFSLVFPIPKWPFRTHPLLTLALLYLLEPVLILLIGGPLAQAGPYVGFGLVAVYGLLTVISVIHTIITERRDPVARAQILWVGFGVALVTGFQFLENTLGISMTIFIKEVGVAPWWENLIGRLIYLALPITIAIAILRYRLFDIDVIIRRTLIYGALTLTLALVYFGSVVLLQSLFTAVSGQSSTLALVISTLGIAALFTPLRRRIQRDIDRRFYRRKYDSEQTLAAFAATARDQVELENLAEALLSVVQETMQPDQVSLWLKPVVDRRNENRS